MPNNRATAMSIWEDDSTQAKLNAIQAGYIERIQKTGNAFRFKSTNANLTKKAGSYEFKRFVNSKSNPYGTARANHKGDQLIAPTIPVVIDTHKEIVEEFSAFDADGRFALDSTAVSVISSRASDHQMTIDADVEDAFWYKVYLAALAGDPIGMKGQIVPGLDLTSSVSVDYQIETNAIVPLETVRNKYVRAVPRGLMGGVLRPGAYSKLKTTLNKLFNTGFNVGDQDIQGINGVAFFPEAYLPPKVDGIVTIKGIAGQPLDIRKYQGERIPLSDDYAVESFYHYGTEALCADLAVVMIELDKTHTKAKVVSALPTTGQATDTIYVLDTKSTAYYPDAEGGISSTNYPAGTMFTYAGSAWTQYNK